MQSYPISNRVSWDYELMENTKNWIELYNKRLFYIAFSILGDEFLAQDCVQEAFIKAGIKARQLKNKDKPFVWLAKILINECRSLSKKKWLTKVVITNEIEAETKEDDYPSLCEANLHQLVMRLPYKQRTVIQLYYWNDCSIKDVSEIMDITESTCKVCMHRARLKLKQMIGEGFQ